MARRSHLIAVRVVAAVRAFADRDLDCCLYERGEEHPYEKITFAQFSLDWLTDGSDQLA